MSTYVSEDGFDLAMRRLRVMAGEIEALERAAQTDDRAEIRGRMNAIVARKHELLTGLPGFPISEKILLPFEALYWLWSQSHDLLLATMVRFDTESAKEWEEKAKALTGGIDRELADDVVWRDAACREAFAGLSKAWKDYMAALAFERTHRQQPEFFVLEKRVFDASGEIFEARARLEACLGREFPWGSLLEKLHQIDTGVEAGIGVFLVELEAPVLNLDPEFCREMIRENVDRLETSLAELKDCVEGLPRQ